MTGRRLSGPALAAVYDRLAERYDQGVLGLFPFAADQLLRSAKLRPGDKVLDVGAGTGAIALAAAPMVAPGGRVTAIDLSEGMLARLQSQAERMGLANVDVHSMDAAHLEFRRGYFDVVTAGFVLCQLDDPPQAVAGWLRALKPGGELLVAALGARAFAPMVEHLRAVLADLGGAPPPFPCAAPEGCRALLEAAGARDVEVAVQDFGYHLAHAEEWWTVIWNSGLFPVLHDLDPAALGELRRRHLAYVAERAGEAGIQMSVPVCLARGRAP